MTCKIFYSTTRSHCVTKLCKQHCAFCNIVQPTFEKWTLVDVMSHAWQTKIRLLHGSHMIHFPHPTIFYKSLMTPIIMNAPETKRSKT